MHNFTEKSCRFRLEIIGYIKDFLRDVNRSIVIPKGKLTYMCFDYSQPPTEDDMTALIPEMELTMMGLDEDGELLFNDASGEEVYSGSLDTEELVYVADFVDELKEEADRQLSYGELYELNREFDDAFVVDEDCEDDWSDKGLGANARLTYIEDRRTGAISGPDEFDCPDKWRKSTKS